jgi:CheY-like chemotaxis protein
VSLTLVERRGGDRRRRWRGGRRPTDRSGSTPLVLVADDNPDSRTTCETILAKLHFAVAPVDSVDRALVVMATLRPEVIVARVRDASPLVNHGNTPCVIMTDEMRDPDVLADAIRRALRNSRAS